MFSESKYYKVRLVFLYNADLLMVSSKVKASQA